ncbi:amino acid permease [Klebsiella pneumoniae]|uniref:amino acid permease n=1 Tax=Klebsiella pneumoniae TaxID=573 RepID=UPI00313132A9
MEKKLGLSALTALVLSSMLGAGVFSLPQNMAAVASPSALLIGWAITGVGILFLAFAMLLLTRIRPDLDGGIFTYAREGFGELIGFCSAWGYWLCAVIANVSYLVIVFSALSFFTDTPELRLFGDGNTWQSIVGASVLLWVVHFLILRGVQTAAGINLVATLAKLLPLGAFVALAALAFQLDTFRLDFSGLALGVPVWEQVKNTMLITLLSLGVVPRSELAEMRNPSMAGLMVRLMGSWGEIVIAAGLIVSVCGAYLSWTIMAAEVPFLAATHKAFPRLFARQNSNNAPSASLWLTNISVQVSLVLIWLTGSDYGTLLTIASEMILVPYLLVGAFLLKIATRPLHKAVAIGACIYGIWLLYASGPVHLLLSVVLYAPGLLVFLYARRTHQHDRSLKRREVALIGLLLVAAVPATWMLVG